jgi:hypothetical protein
LLLLLAKYEEINTGSNLCVCVVMEVENVEESVSTVLRTRVGLDPRDEPSSWLLSIWPVTELLEGSPMYALMFFFKTILFFSPKRTKPLVY